MQFIVGKGRVALNVRDRYSLMTIVEDRLRRGQGFALATMNVDHLEKLQFNRTFRAAYAAHDLVVADGNPVVWLARLAGHQYSLVPGSDLVQPLCALAARLDKPIAIIGGNQEGCEEAAHRLTAQHPGLRIAMVAAPGFPFDPEGAEADGLIRRLAASGASLCLVALGAPRQEIFAARASRHCHGVGFASVGAGIDFIVGRQRRAPRVMRTAKLEWLWRAALSPKRLGLRYVKGAMILPAHALRAIRERSRQR
nr:WecB/TagA/CpsF family glycosyltransferase [Paracoccus saliphilus]